MNKICVYTCITGEYDNLKEIKKENGIDYICYTNNKKLKSKTWKIKYIEDKKLNNVQLARKIKILGTDELKKYDLVVWIDANIKWTTSIKSFITKYVNLNKYDLVGFKHYCRNNIFEEILACIEYGKIDINQANNLIKFYKNEKYQDNNGLIESTILFREFKNNKLNNTMKQWFDMIVNYTHRDQLSFNYVAWKNNLNINLLNIKIWNNKYFKAFPHSNGNTELIIIPFNSKSEPIYSKIKNILISDNTKNYTLKFSEKDKYTKIHIILNTKNSVIINKIKTNDEVYYYNCEHDEKLIYFIGNPKMIEIINPSKSIYNIKMNIIGDKSKAVSQYAKRINELSAQLKVQTDIANTYKNEYYNIINSKRYKLITNILKIIKR